MKQKPNTILFLSLIYEQLNNGNNVIITNKHFCKVLDRLTKANRLHRISAGIYVVPIDALFGNIPFSEETIISSIIKNSEDGMKIGYQLYNKHRLTTQVPMKRIFYTNAIDKKHMWIDNIHFI